MPERDTLLKAIDAQKRMIQAAKKAASDAREAKEREEQLARLRAGRSS